MKWRVVLELVGPDGIVGVHEVGGRAAIKSSLCRLRLGPPSDLRITRDKGLLSRVGGENSKDSNVADRFGPKPCLPHT
jgi:hypothetical protein